MKKNGLIAFLLKKVMLGVLSFAMLRIVMHISGIFKKNLQKNINNPVKREDFFGCDLDVCQTHDICFFLINIRI